MGEADEVERWPPWVARLYAMVSSDPPSNHAVIAYADPGPGDVVVDIGCGAGAALRLAADRGARAIGVEPSPAMADQARRRSVASPLVEVRAGHAADLPVDDASVSHVLAIATYHHWPDRRAGLEEVRRALAPGGRVFIGEARTGWLCHHGLSESDVQETIALLEDTGFRNARAEVVRPRLLRMTILSATK